MMAPAPQALTFTALIVEIVTAQGLWHNYMWILLPMMLNRLVECIYVYVREHVSAWVSTFVTRPPLPDRTGASNLHLTHSRLGFLGWRGRHRPRHSQPLLDAPRDPLPALHVHMPPRGLCSVHTVLGGTSLVCTIDHRVDPIVKLERQPESVLGAGHPCVNGGDMDQLGSFHHFYKQCPARSYRAAS